MIKEYFLDYQRRSRTTSCSRTGTRRPAARQRHGRLEDHVRRHGTSVDASAIVSSLARSHIGDDEIFLATYGDGLTDAPLDDMIEHARVRAGKIGTLPLRAARVSTYHVVDADEDGDRPLDRARSTHADVRINGGFFVFRREIFDDIKPGEELVDEPFARLIATRASCIAYRYEGFWEPMDTIKDKQHLDALVESGKAPWQTVPRARATRTDVRSSPLAAASRPLRRVLVLGCHADDIEIGCGGDDPRSDARAARSSTSHGSCSLPTGEREPTRRARAQPRSSRRAGSLDVRVHELPRRLPSVRRAATSRMSSRS